MGTGHCEGGGYSSAGAVKEALFNLYNRLYEEYVEVPNPPGTIYHYCSARVMRKILFESHGLWASDIFSMRDQEEFTYPFKGTFDVDRGTVQEFWKRVCIHIACLSADAELSSQWDNYADKHRGFAIGFNRAAIQAFCSERPGPLLIPMTYEPRGHTEMMRRLLDGVRTIFKRGLRQADRDVHEEDLQWEATKYLLSLATTMKRECFKDEREWRILATQAKRANGGEPRRLQPFPRPDTGACCFNIPIGIDDFVEEVVVGSRCDEDVGELRTTLISGGFPSVGVRRSSLP